MAFIGQVSNNGVPQGDSIFAQTASSTTLTAVAPTFLSPSRTFGQAVQVNASNQIVSQDRFAGNPPSYFLRNWDGNNPGNSTLVAKATRAPTDMFKAILGSPAINGSSNVAFSALDLGFNGVLADTSVTTAGTINETAVKTPVMPMISDQNQPTDFPIVVRAGNTDQSPIVLYTNDFSKAITVASPTEFNSMGRRPGISRDGLVVAFAGDLNSTAAATFKTNPGPGIFLAIVQNGA